MKSKNKIIIGIDTSCYTTSIAAISFDREILFNEKIMLKVGKDQKGLRQSEAVFQHVNNLGYLSDKLNNILEEYSVEVVCASARPRPVEGSYMPVFNVGLNFAKLYASMAGAKFYKTSHQENHIEAVLAGVEKINRDKFISVHLSGGTTEILISNSSKGGSYDSEIVGGSNDVSFGQLIDRLGVKLGYEFPSGKFIDKNAINSTHNIEKGLKTSVKDGYMNLSGIENQINKEIDERFGGVDNIDESGSEYISKLLMDTLVRNLYKALIFISKESGVKEVLFAGGVSSSKYISNNLRVKLEKSGIVSYFSSPEYSTDNAVGCAIIGINKMEDLIK